jgi:hypothetical protein
MISSEVPVFPEKQLTRQIFWLVVTVGLLVSGARLASSDEVAIYLLTDNVLTRGALDVPGGITPNGSWFGDKFYIWYEPGMSLFVVPWYLFGRLVTGVLPLDESLASLGIKAVVSTFNAWIAAWLAVAFFRCCRLFSVGLRAAAGMSLTLVFSTFLFPYLKTIIRDVPLALLLLLAVEYAVRYVRTKESRYLWLAGSAMGLGILTKIVFVMYVPIIAGYLWMCGRQHGRPLFQAVRMGVPVAVSFLLIGIYNAARFGDFFDMGYHGGTSFPTPVLVGLFGLLLSPGKGLFWFAPVVWICLWSWGPFARRFKAESRLLLVLAASTILLYAKYFAWGGDGSWGPRYLIVILPLLLLVVAGFADGAARAARRTVGVLAALGLVIQIGGVAIYQGNYLRKAGDFPFTRPFTDPEFMARTHYVPNYSPIVGHWKMLADNLRVHAEGPWPSLIPSGEHAAERVPLDESQKAALLQAFDLWFMYAAYAGVAAVPSFALAGLLLIAVVVLTVRLARTLRDAS